MAKRLALILILVLIGGAVFLAASRLGTRPGLTQPILVAILNAVFLALTLFVIAALAARAYMATGLKPTLWLGAGSLAFGLGSLFYGIQDQINSNAAMLTLCLGAAVAAGFYLQGIFHSAVAFDSTELTPQRKRYTILLYYLPLTAGLLLVNSLTYINNFPLFYRWQTGPDLANFVVVAIVVTLLLTSWAGYLIIYYRSKMNFLFWYSWAIFLLAAGLLLINLNPNDTLQVWLGRMTQYVGGAFLIIAVLSTVRQARAEKSSLQQIVAGFFLDPRASYELLVETSGDAVLATDAQGRVVLWNSAAGTLFGYPREGIVGHPVAELFAGREGRYLQDRLNGLAADGFTQTIIDKRKEMTALRKDGSLFPVAISFSARRTPSGQMAVIIARDITEMKQARNAVLKANAELEQKVKERTAELEDLNQQLRLLAEKLALTEEQDRQRIAVELHDNVSQMLAVCNLELGAALGQAPGELKAQLEKILDIIEKLSTESRSLMFQLSPPALYDLGLEAAVEELAVLLEEQKDISISVDWDGQPAPLSAEAKITLFQVVRELLNIILRYPLTGGVSVLFNRNGELEIAIEEDGAGIDPLRPGSDLVQMRERVRTLGGQLEIQSPDDRVTRILIQVPLSPGSGKST